MFALQLQAKQTMKKVLNYLLIIFGVFEIASAQTVIFQEDFESSPTITNTTVGTYHYQSTSNGSCLVSQRWELGTPSASTSNYNCNTCSGSQAAQINDSYSSGCDNTYEDYTLHVGKFTASLSSYTVEFDWGMHDSDYDPSARLIIILFDLTDNLIEGAELINKHTSANITDLTGHFNQTLSFDPGHEYEFRITWDTENLYYTSGGSSMDNFAQVDNFIVTSPCTIPTTSISVDEANCSSSFDVDVNISALGTSTSLDLYVDGVFDQTITSTGIYSISNVSAGNSVSLSLDYDCGLI